MFSQNSGVLAIAAASFMAVGEVASLKGLLPFTEHEQRSNTRIHHFPITFVAQQMLIVPVPHPAGQRATQAAHVGDIDQPELVIRSKDDVAHVQGTEIHA